MAPTVSQVLALHIRRHTLRKATLTMYREKIRRFIEFLNGDLPVNEVSEDKCLSFRDAVLARCQPSTFNILRRHIVVVFRLAVKEGFIVSSPWANIPPANVLQKPPRKVSTINVDRALVMLSQKFVQIGRASCRERVLMPV